MRRRALLTAIVGATSLSGCLSEAGSSPSGSTITSQKDGGTETYSPKDGETETPIRHTADGIVATFQVVDGHRPTDDTASATFNDEQVTITGTMDPSECNRPALRAVQYNVTDGIAHLRIGGESPYGQTATIECGNASFDYQSVLFIDRGRPTAVEVVHDHRGKENESFVLERN